MKNVTVRVLVEVRDRGMGPARVNHRQDGRTTLCWHVDGGDDRFAELTDSARGDDFLLVVRDGRRCWSAVVGVAGLCELLCCEILPRLAAGRVSTPGMPAVGEQVGLIVSAGVMRTDRVVDNSDEHPAPFFETGSVRYLLCDRGVTWFSLASPGGK